MLETHRTDLIIIEAIAAMRSPPTVAEIDEQIKATTNEKFSEATIGRHLAGLLRIGRVRGEKCFREERLVTVWRLSKLEAEFGPGLFEHCSSKTTCD